ncbi:MAG: hypothetical protein GH155_07575 [Spirochaeta sp.]|nr:hypothetical protein [Spirochaeta sp.]
MRSRQSLSQAAGKIFSGYNSALKGTLLIVLLLLASSITAFILVFPLWFLANSYRVLYNYLVISILSLMLLFLCFRSLLRSRSQYGGWLLLAEKNYLPKMFKVLAALIFLLLLYLVIFIFARGWWPAGILLTVLFLITFGYYKFVRR